MSAQGLGERRLSVDLSVEPREYFGMDPREFRNIDAFGIVPQEGKDLYRVQYLYLLVFGREKSATEYGGIQIRADTHLYLEDGRVPMKMQRNLQRIAHRGAFLFDSGIETSYYGSGGKEWADGGGYLSGFNAVEANGEYQNWEVEPVGTVDGKPRGTQPGVIRWTTEIYLEVDGTEYAELSGVAQGLSNPYTVTEDDVPPSPPVEAQQEWWQIAENHNDARGAYQIAAPAYSSGRKRARKLRGKDVYLNGLRIGDVTKDGRVWLKDEYQAGPSYRGQYSRAAIIDQTAATAQSIALGRPIAKIDESPGAVHLATKRARPDDFDPVDPDEVDPDLVVREGVEGGTIFLLRMADPEEATRQIARQDEQIIDHLGYSNPPYEHSYDQMWRWPGFRPIEEHGTVTTWEERFGTDEFDPDEWRDDR